MTFSLYVDAADWRAHAESVRDAVPGLVPVAKGNGYGFGLQLLADQCQRLGVDTLAVGTIPEVELVHDGFAGDVLVLTPWHPIIDAPPPLDDRLVLTLGHVEAVHALAGSPTRVVVELLTSMDRFGLDHDELVAALPTIGQLNLAGFALHLPLDEGETARVDEVSHWVQHLTRLGVEIPSLWVSHLGDDELATLRRRHPAIVLRPRIGTRLWLGPPRTYQARGTVLAVHPTRRGERFGYRQRKAPSDGHLLIVAGGTSHGVALSAPRPVAGVMPRAKAAALGGLEAAGRVLSPFYVAGKRRWFGEPPHMQVSMVLLPGDVTPPLVGDELDVDMRMTTALFDRVVLQ
ncbi:MAG: alanine racemase [Actinomycetes bacterium]